MTIADSRYADLLIGYGGPDKLEYRRNLTAAHEPNAVDA